MHTPYLKFRILKCLEFVIFDDYMNNFKNESFGKKIKKIKNDDALCPRVIPILISFRSYLTPTL